MIRKEFSIRDRSKKMQSKKTNKKYLSFFILIVSLILFSKYAKGEDLGTIQPGQIISSSIYPLGDTDTINFSGTAGETVIIVMEDTGEPWGEWVDIYDPDGIKEASGFDIDGHKLLKSGTYTIVCSAHANAYTGNYNISFQKIPGPMDLGSIRPGEVKSSSIEKKTDVDMTNFYGTAGETVIIVMEDTGDPWGEWVELYDPDGIKEASGFDIDGHHLLKSGLYTIVCRAHANYYTGNYNLSFQKIPGPFLTLTDGDGGDILSGNVVSGNISPKGDIDGYNFYGNAGETVIIVMEDTGDPWGEWVELYDPDGDKETSGFDINGHLLLKSGLYTIVCRAHANYYTGSYNLSLSKIPAAAPPGVYNPDPSNGAAVPVTTNQLDWSNTQGATHYDVYFGTNVLQPLQKIAENLTVSQCFLPSLTIETIYYWKVVAKSGSTEIPGPVYMFYAATESSPPTIALNRTDLNFGHVLNGDVTGSRSIVISNIGEGTLNWSAAADISWVNVNPSSGTGGGVLTVSANTSGVSVGTYTGTITVSDPNATNSPQTVSVLLIVYSPGGSSPPFGDFATPIHGSTVSSSIAVTGWVLDDLGVESVKIYSGQTYIGDAVFVEGARTDIETVFPDYPQNYQAGWGYMLLTNFLPGGGNGVYTLKAIAKDIEGHQVTLGSKTITVDNVNAVKPFGAIDTPTQGGTASGSSFKNQGWVLTPLPNKVPEDGSTIKLYIDSVLLNNPAVYNLYRSDIAGYFPGYANSDGALAYFDIETTAYSNGVHQIFWIAADNAGNTDGIGSRFFIIQNSGSSRSANSTSAAGFTQKSPIVRFEDLENLPIEYNEPVRMNTGFREEVEPKEIYLDNRGIAIIKIKELERVIIRLTHNRDASIIAGYMFNGSGNRLRPLPIGSTLDPNTGTFYWLPGPGFFGEYGFVFIEKKPDGMMNRKDILIKISPKCTIKVEEAKN
jgi:hypothetical protein